MNPKGQLCATLCFFGMNQGYKTGLMKASYTPKNKKQKNINKKNIIIVIKYDTP